MLLVTPQKHSNTKHFTIINALRKKVKTISFDVSTMQIYFIECRYSVKFMLSNFERCFECFHFYSTQHKEKTLKKP